MTQMVQQLKTNTSAAIYLLTPTIIHENLRGPENLKLEAYCQAVREIARREGVHLVDLNAVFNLALRSTQIGGAPEFHPTSDGVHMKPAGNFPDRRSDPAGVGSPHHSDSRSNGCFPTGHSSGRRPSAVLGPLGPAKRPHHRGSYG